MTEEEILGTVQPTYRLSALNNTVGFASKLLLFLVCGKEVHVINRSFHWLNFNKSRGG